MSPLVQWGSYFRKQITRVPLLLLDTGVRSGCAAVRLSDRAVRDLTLTGIQIDQIPSSSSAQPGLIDLYRVALSSGIRFREPRGAHLEAADLDKSGYPSNLLVEACQPAIPHLGETSARGQLPHQPKDRNKERGILETCGPRE